MSLPTPTPHINAQKGAFAKTVLMPGDPHRAKLIAEKFLTNAVLVNDVRGIQGYTGEYKGKKVSVMASGMGIPSMGIYSYELFHAYDVENIIRIGTCGALKGEIKCKDMIVATGACTDSNYGANFGLKGNSAVPSFKLLKKADEISTKLGFKDRTKFGQILSSDIFYSDQPGLLDWAKIGVLAVEMEAYGPYLNV
jgi:purine-nucleoside phosphorylase